MKNGPLLFLLLGFLLALSACGGDKRSYIADFDIKDLGNNPLYAVHKSYDGKIRIDTVWPKNNFFRVKGEADSLSRIDLYSTGFNRLFSLYIQNGDHIEVDGQIEKLSSAKIKGGGINNDIADFYQEHAAMMKTRDSLLQRLALTPPENRKEYTACQNISDSLSREIGRAVATYADRNRRSAATVALVAENMLLPENLPLCDSVMQLLSPKAKQGNPVARREIEQFLKESYDIASDTLFKGFSLKNEKDSTVRIDSLYGKPAVLHFWSASLPKNGANNSWLNDATFHFPDSAIHIISIAFDLDTALWKQNLRNNPYRGIKLIEPRRFNSAITQEYGIRQLPNNVVIDRQGRIVGRNLKSTEMAALLQEISRTRVEPTDSIPH